MSPAVDEAGRDGGGASRPVLPALRGPWRARRGRGLVAGLLLAASFFVLGGVHLDALGVLSEEILPHLFLHPRVADPSGDEGGAGLGLLAPYDRAGQPAGEGLQVAAVWPTLSVITASRTYPLLTEAWQAAYLSYPAAVLAPLLGRGLDGLRRVSLLLGAGGVLLLAVLAGRVTRGRGPPAAGGLAAALLASSAGYLFIHRLAYLIEVGPPLAALLALFFALEPAPAEPPVAGSGSGLARRDAAWAGASGARRLVLAGLFAGLAVALKVTAAWVLGGMALYLLLARRVPRPPRWAWAAATLAGVVPLAPFALLWALGGPPGVVGRKLALLALPGQALARLPHAAWVAGAYLGRPMALLGPIFRGELSTSGSAWAAAVPAAVTVYAAARVALRKGDREPELLWLCTAGVVVVATALFYDDREPFQVAFYLAPLHALVFARAVLAAQAGAALLSGRLSVRLRPDRLPRESLAIPALGLLVAFGQGRELWELAAAHGAIGNPMLSMPAERQLVAALLARGERAPLTVTYNSPGFYEYLSGGALAPVHLYPLFYPREGLGATDPADAAWAFRRAFACAPGPVVLPLGDNPVEGGREDLAVVRAAFPVAAAAAHLKPREVGRFPRGEGPALLALYELEPVAGEAPVACAALGSGPRRGAKGGSGGTGERGAGQAEPASAETLAALGGLATGARVGAFVVEAISGPADGAVAVRARRGDEGVTFEIRLDSEGENPPARAGAYAVYYRRAPEVSPADLVAGAEALAAILGRAPAGAAAVPGLRAMPARRGQPM